MRPGSILALITDGFGGSDGIAQYNRDLLTALCSVPGIHRIEVLPRLGGRASPEPGLEQHEGRSGRLGYSLAALQLGARVSPDLVFCGHLLMLPLAAGIARWLRVPLWLQIHGIDAWTCPNRAVARAVRSVDVVTSVSRYTRGRFLEWATLDPAAVRVLPNTVRPRYQPGDREKARRLFNLAPDRPALLTVGRMAASERYKGHDQVLDCLVGSSALRGLTYLIAGGGDDVERLRTRVEAEGIDDVVRFLGRVPDEQLPDLYRAADLFVMPSSGEGFGIVFLEAMASGTMAVGLSGDGSADALRDGTLGRMARPGTLCEVIAEALAEPRPSDLAARTVEIFGREAYRAQVHALVDRWWPLSGSRECAV